MSKKNLSRNLRGKSRVRFCKDYKVHRKISDASTSRRFTLTKKMIMDLRPWNNEMLKILNSKVESMLELREIVEMFAGKEFDSNSVLKAYSKSSIYKRLRDMNYKTYF